MQIRLNRTAITSAVAIVTALFLCITTAGAASVRDKLEGMDTREFHQYAIDVVDKPFGELIPDLQKYSGLNILPGQFKDVKITWSIEHPIAWQDALGIMLKMMNADIQIINEKTIEVVPSTWLFVEEADLRTAIYSLACGSGKNVIIDPDVSGKITLTLEGVPFEDALRAIAEAGGYRVVKEGDNLWRVASPDKLITQLITKRITLKYLWPEAPYRAAMDSKVAIGPQADERYNAFAPEHQPEQNFTVLKALRQMLTRDPADAEKFIGHIEYIPVTNTLVIVDVKPKVDEIIEIIEEIDRPPYQIMIDVKFITTTNTDFFEFGIDFANGLTAAANGASTFIRFPFSRGSSWFTRKLSAYGPSGTGGSLTGGAGLGSGSYAGLFADPDQDGGADRLPYSFGSLDFSQLQATLRLLKQDQGTEIMQRPQILTLNNKEATIFVGSRVRFAQTIAASNQQGGLTFAIEEAASSPVDSGFQLLILPRVIEGEIRENGTKTPDRIMMTVVPESRALTGTTSEIPGFNKFTTNDGVGGTLSIDLPEVATSSLVTNMILKSNQTAVIGGLVIESETEGIRQVPFFSRIPILGYLMKRKVHNIIKSNLLIFITPRIVYSDAEIEEIFARELHRNRTNLPHKYPEDANGHRRFDVERVYDVLYGRPNPYDAWREFDEMPKPKENDNVQPTEPEPEKGYSPENRREDRSRSNDWNNKWNNTDKTPAEDYPHDTGTTPGEHEENKVENEVENTEWNTEEEKNSEVEDSEPGVEAPPEYDADEPVIPDNEEEKSVEPTPAEEPVIPDNEEEKSVEPTPADEPVIPDNEENNEKSVEPTPAEEQAYEDHTPLPEKEEWDESSASESEDQPTEKESFGELEEKPVEGVDGDAEDTESGNTTE